jgi:hypothetical protein
MLAARRSGVKQPVFATLAGGDGGFDSSLSNKIKPPARWRKIKAKYNQWLGFKSELNPGLAKGRGSHDAGLSVRRPVPALAGHEIPDFPCP